MIETTVTLPITNFYFLGYRNNQKEQNVFEPPLSLWGLSYQIEQVASCTNYTNGGIAINLFIAWMHIHTVH